MTIGDHLEELRARLMFGMAGFVLAFVLCVVFSQRVAAFFLNPLTRALQKTDINPQIYYTQVADVFITYMKICAIAAVAMASPWMVYQLWQFVAAGLYPRERRYVTKYLPLSITLLISGMVFLYYVVLPLTLEFFLTFSIGMPLAVSNPTAVAPPSSQPVVQVPVYAGDPRKPVENQIWVDSLQRRLKIYLNNEVRVIPFGPTTLTAPMITLPQYIEMVIGLLVSFGVAFQMPLVILALVRLGIVEIASLRKWRKIVYFSMSIVAAVIVPDIVTGMVALMIPLCLLYEFGILLASWGRKARMSS